MQSEPNGSQRESIEELPGEPTLPEALWYRVQPVLRLVGSFFLGQGALQAINLVVSFYLLRSLSIEAYAQFSLAYSFQVTAASLMDLGVAGTIIPLVGDRITDRVLIGRYTRAAKHLRDRTFLAIGPMVAVAFLAIAHRHGWPVGTQVLLLLSILLALYASGPVSYFSAPLFLAGRLRDYYTPLVATNVSRFFFFIAGRAVGILSAPLAAGVNAISQTVNGVLLGRGSRNTLQWPTQAEPKLAREMVRYILPSVPAILFGGFQSQITVFVISIFGRSTSIAEVGALSRLAQIFAVLTTFNVVVVEPYFARLQPHRISRAYAAIAAAAIAACGALVALTFLFPGPILVVLGSKYSDLRPVVGYAVLGASIYYLAGLLWVLNRARKWVFWSGTFVEIGITLIAQVTYIAFFGVRSTRQAVFFSLASSFCPLLSHLYVAALGFWRGGRQAPV